VGAEAAATAARSKPLRLRLVVEVKSPDEKPGLNIRSINMRHVPVTDGAFVPQRGSGKCELAHTRDRLSCTRLLILFVQMRDDTSDLTPAPIRNITGAAREADRTSPPKRAIQRAPVILVPAQVSCGD
jgi:hypothetical protein